jgi:hypothetical protein
VACDGVDLDELTRDAAYLTRMPVDPTVGEGEAETGYAIWMDEIGIINVTAALAEPLPGGRKQ